ncbi:MAG: hypothetical protein JNL08_07380 [Planctomycetes bacterium]|nr:hypothetical protein [Planctomycetota bacterium]
MTGDAVPRLDRAMTAFLRHRREGGSRAEFLARHEDLRDLLEPMLAESAADPGAGETAAAGRRPATATRSGDCS